jgi:hypothetical protein
MKILLLADIHSNWAALSAIKETYDVCLFLGDLVDYATDPSGPQRESAATTIMRLPSEFPPSMDRDCGIWRPPLGPSIGGCSIRRA